MTEDRLVGQLAQTRGVGAQREEGVGEQPLAGTGDGGAIRPPFALLTTLNAAMQRVPARDTVRGTSFAAVKGERLDEAQLRGFLSRMGFSQSPTVTEPGDYAIRGGVIDAWYAPNITPDDHTGIGGWSDDQVVTYLKTGAAPGNQPGVAAGPVSRRGPSRSRPRSARAGRT